MTKKTEKNTTLDLGLRIRKKEVEPKLYVVTMKAITEKRLNLLTSVSVSYTLDDSIEKAREQSSFTAKQAGREIPKALWTIDSYVSFDTAKIITMFSEFKNETGNKNTTS